MSQQAIAASAPTIFFFVVLTYGPVTSITLLSICLPTGYCFCKIAGHGVECQSMAAKY
jgi:hypothetical protein